MVSLLVCLSMALLYSSSADGNPTELIEIEAFYPKEKPILRQLPQNYYWYTPRLGKRQWDELSMNYDSEDPTGSDKEKRAQHVKKYNTIFTPRTGKRSDANIGRLSDPPPLIGQEVLEALSGKSY